MGLQILFFILGAVLTPIGVWCVRERRREGAHPRDFRSQLLGGRSAREVLLWLNGWPSLVAGIALLVVGFPGPIKLVGGLSRARLADRLTFECDHRSLVVTSRGRTDIRVNLLSAGVVVGVDHEGIPSINPVDLGDNHDNLVLAPGASGAIPIGWPTAGSCSSPDAGGECAILDLYFEATDGQRTVHTSRDCALPDLATAGVLGTTDTDPGPLSGDWSGSMEIQFVSGRGGGRADLLLELDIGSDGAVTGTFSDPSCRSEPACPDGEPLTGFVDLPVATVWLSVVFDCKTDGITYYYRMNGRLDEERMWGRFEAVDANEILQCSGSWSVTPRPDTDG